ncbi:MAG: hypothetical protein HZA37_00960 [Parcubacteria group bacterium]|nr:hypothetical protein [Parcubacteria group bacterium]
MKHLSAVSLFALISLVLLNGAFVAVGIYQASAYHQDWCQNWCLQIKPLWLNTAQAVASPGIFAAAAVFFAVILSTFSAKTLALLLFRPKTIPPRFPAGNFFSPIFLALRRRRVQPLLFD